MAKQDWWMVKSLRNGGDIIAIFIEPCGEQVLIRQSAMPTNVDSHNRNTHLMRRFQPMGITPSPLHRAMHEHQRRPILRLRNRRPRHPRKVDTISRQEIVIAKIKRIHKLILFP